MKENCPQMLIDYGANGSHRDAFDYTPLHIKKLIEKRASRQSNINTKTTRASTPLHYASYTKSHQSLIISMIRIIMETLHFILHHKLVMMNL